MLDRCVGPHQRARDGERERRETEEERRREKLKRQQVKNNQR